MIAKMQIDLSGIVSDVVSRVESQTVSRAFRAANELRNAEIEVLSGEGGGRTYRKSPFKTKYTASAPGSPPAERSGTLKKSFRPVVEGGRSNVTSAIVSSTFYSNWLQTGTRKMAPRPYREPIIEKAKPRVTAIFSEPYL